MASRKGIRRSRLVSAAVAERDKLRRRLEVLQARQRVLLRELEDLANERARIEDELLVLNRMTDESGETPAQRQSEASERRELQPLRGQSIREAAVRVLASSARADEVMHHAEWYAMFVDAGFAASGKDPQNSFLVQVGRSPLVRRGDRPGTYYLDLQWPSGARAQLADLRGRLARAEVAGSESSSQSLQTKRQERARLIGSIDRLERQLEEALRSLESSSRPAKAKAA